MMNGSYQLLRQLHRIPIGDESVEICDAGKSPSPDDEEEDEVNEEEDENEGDEGEEAGLFGQQIDSGVPLLLPNGNQQQQNGKLGRDDWGDAATFVLLQAWGDKCTRLNKWHLRKEHWGELAAAVTGRSGSVKTDIQCKNRVDTLKKKFKHEKQKQASSGVQSKWPFYSILERLLTLAVSSKSINPVGNGSSPRSSNPNPSRNLDAENIVRNRFQANGLPSSGSSDDEEPADEEYLRKRKRRRKASSPSLTGAISRLGQVFERMEECKRQRMVDLEKLRVQLTRDLELHRMQLLLQTQVELSKIKRGMNELDV